MRFKPHHPLVPNSKREKKPLPRPAIPMHFPRARPTTGCAAIFASYRSPSLFHSVTDVRMRIYIYSRSVPPVRFTAFPPRCIHKTNPNSHGVALMPAERMRNAYACTAHIPVATGSMSSLCRCVNTRPRALSRATRVFVRGYGSERRARGPTGGSWHTSSGGFPSHVSRGENVPPAGRKGR